MFVSSRLFGSVMHVIVAEMGIRAGLASRHRGQENKTGLLAIQWRTGHRVEPGNISEPASSRPQRAMPPAAFASRLSKLLT